MVESKFKMTFEIDMGEMPKNAFQSFIMKQVEIMRLRGSVDIVGNHASGSVKGTKRNLELSKSIETDPRIKDYIAPEMMKQFKEVFEAEE